MSAPTLPPAPARLSTMNCCPNAFESSGAIARARMSVVPPAGKGTTMRTGLAGQATCANAGAAASAADIAIVVRTNRLLELEYLLTGTSFFSGQGLRPGRAEPVDDATV